MERCQGSTHADGSWVPRAAPPYEIMPAAFYARFQDASHSLPRSFHGAAAGLTCDDRSFTRRKEPRKHYEWRPRACALDAWDRTRACALLEERDVRQVVVVGDSISEQIYVSLVMLLQGLDGFGPPVNGSTRVVAAKGAELHSKAAVACDGRVRLSYARNDLLLWSSSGVETNLVRWCAGNTILEPWAVRAVHDADLLVLGAGIHAVSSLESINSSAAAAFPAHNLRHTLRRLVAERAKRGAAPESVVVLGAPLPTPGCESIGAPLTLSGAALHAGWLKAHPFAAQWRQLQHFNQAAQWVAQDAGVVWIDIAALSRTRPDAAVAAHGLGTPASRGRVSSVGDCVHTCQPGPIDEYVRLLFHEVRSRTALRVPASTPSTRRFFSVSEAEWLRHRPLERHGGVGLPPELQPAKMGYLCASAAPWFPYLECRGRSASQHADFCLGMLDAETKRSLMEMGPPA